MNFTFENQGNSTYLVYKISDKDELDSLSLGMVKNNKIKGISPILFTQMDTEKYLKYNITAKVPVSKFFTGAVTKKRLLGVFSGIVDSILAAEEYMIDTSIFVLDLDYIFVDVTTCETLIICLPVLNNKSNTTDMSSFFKDIVFGAQYDQTENTDYVAKIVSYLNGTSIFSLNDFGAMIKKLIIETTQAGQAQAVAVNPVVQQPVAVHQPVAANTMVQKPGSAQHKTAPVSIGYYSEQATPVVYAPSAYASKDKKIVQPIVPQAKTQTQQSFAVPGGKGKTPAVQNNTIVPIPNGEKKITLFHLLMHYDKKTKAEYDAQKQRAKQSKANAAQTASKTPEYKKGSNAPANGFALPGADNTMPHPVQKQPPQHIAQNPIPQHVQQTPSVQTYQPVSNSAVTGQSANFGETTVLSSAAAGATTVLGVDPASQAAVPHLIRTKNNERINLSKPVFRIGKEKSFVDYFIGDNTAISRSHADFTTRGGEYFVTDMNSTNHTYVNGSMIQSSIEVKLTHGTKVKLANEEFEFMLY